MVAPSFSPSAHLRRFLGAGPPANPSWLRRHITPVLQSLSRRACTHPIHTIIFVALLASTTYIGLLEGSLFRQVNDAGDVSSRTDWGVILGGSKTLCLGDSTGWKWQIEENGRCIESEKVCTKASSPISPAESWPRQARSKTTI